MKKLIITFSGLLLVTVLVVKVANAQNTPQEVKKASTETKMDCGKSRSTSCCDKMANSKTADTKTVDPSKCKEGKSDTSKCKVSCANMKSGMKECDPAKCNGMTKK
jgi:hypothetical protein